MQANKPQFFISRPSPWNRHRPGRTGYLNLAFSFAKIRNLNFKIRNLNLEIRNKLEYRRRKSEIQISKSETNSNIEEENVTSNGFVFLEYLAFRYCSDFALQISEFPSSSSGGLINSGLAKNSLRSTWPRTSPSTSLRRVSSS